MSGYETRKLNVRIGDDTYKLRALSDKQQYYDPDGVAERAGISSATWSLFGQLWPAGKALARKMSKIDVGGRRVLELGCGLGLSSLVLQRRGANITASDYHPLAEPFLDYNAALNGLPPIDYRDLPWDIPVPDLGRFDLIIGSDILYERDHAETLARLIQRHAAPRSEVIITCPGRRYRGRFSRALKDQGYRLTEKRKPFTVGQKQPVLGFLLRFRRESV